MIPPPRNLPPRNQAGRVKRRLGHAERLAAAGIKLESELAPGCALCFFEDGIGGWGQAVGFHGGFEHAI